MVMISTQSQSVKPCSPSRSRRTLQSSQQITNFAMTVTMGLILMLGIYFSVAKFQNVPPDFEATLKKVCRTSSLPRLEYKGVESFFEYLLNPDKSFCSSWLDFTRENKTKSRTRRDSQFGRHVCATAGGDEQEETCLVYYFTVVDDAQFKKDMDKLTCHVHAIVDKLKQEVKESEEWPRRHPWQISELSYDRALPGGSIRRRRSLKDIVTSLGHVGRKVMFLRADLRGQEWTLLRQVVTYHNLIDVRQISVGLHVPLSVNKLTMEERKRYFENSFKVFEGLTCLGYKHVRVAAIETDGTRMVVPEMGSVTLPSYYEVHWVKAAPQTSGRSHGHSVYY
ncbi:uncharacterized protein LOC122256735 [Penaeus japonicus]|uniref:uncharacterized protein LOC122256735 n=1 Tax=Penaeus japonicus TaxID=27405 RepID=UPI001C710F45|nr:uncharacterized protein LOC122256735 [Penaeus japonicus]